MWKHSMRVSTSVWNYTSVSEMFLIFSEGPLAIKESDATFCIKVKHILEFKQ